MAILLDLAEKIGLSPIKVGATNGGEFHSACPSCGGNDRFIIQPNKKQKKCYGSYFCRQCQKKGDSIQFCMDFLGDSFSDASKKVGACVSSYVNKREKKQPFQPQTVIRPSELFVTKANEFNSVCHQELLKPHNEGVIKYLEGRGLPLEAVKEYKIGLCTKEIVFDLKHGFSDRKNWGLSDELKENNTIKSMYLPQGIVVPTIEPNGDVVRLKIRRTDYKAGDKYPKYVAVSGSMNGLGIIGDLSKEMIVVESELDAYTLHHAASDICFVVAVGSNIKTPDNVTNFFAKKKRGLLICHDNDKGGEAMKAKWCSFYPNAMPYPTPIGKDIGDAFKQGLNVRQFVIDGLCNLAKQLRSSRGSKCN